MVKKTKTKRSSKTGRWALKSKKKGSTALRLESREVTWGFGLRRNGRNRASPGCPFISPPGN
jgi:hypothetical protein